MKSRVFAVVLLLLLSQIIILPVDAIVYDTSNSVDGTEANLLSGEPVVLTGTNSDYIYHNYSPELIITNGTSETKLIACGVWLQTEQNETIEHQIQVHDTGFTEKAQESVHKWLKENSPVTTPAGYHRRGIITQIDQDEPYGVLWTRTEVLKLIEDNSEYDWYVVTVTHRLTPGVNYTTSSWEWNWLQYTMNGSLGASNILLSDYDPPTTEELPEGPFGFLWKILRFDLRNYIPWLFPPEPRVLGLDMSDFSIELFRARYEAPRRYKYRNEPMEERHHYVIRIKDGELPVFWHQTQAQYTQADDFAQIPFITPPLASGYISGKR